MKNHHRREQTNKTRYVLDENVLPEPVYELRPMSVVAADAAVPAAARAFWSDERKGFVGAQVGAFVAVLSRPVHWWRARRKLTTERQKS